MNIAVINVKDVIKYFFKLIVIFLILYICIEFIKGMKSLKKEVIKEDIEKSAYEISNNSFIKILDLTIPIFSYNNESNKILAFSNKNILAMRYSGI